MNIILTVLSPFLFIYTLFDFLFFTIFKRNTNISYRIFRKSFISTSGKINDFLSYLISIFSRKYNHKELNSLNSIDDNLLNEKENFLISMDNNGYYIFKNKMKNNKLEDIKDSLSKITLEYFDFETNKFLDVKNNNYPKTNKLNRSKHFLVNSKGVLSWALSKELVTLAQAYLGAKPICDLLASWKSFPTDDQKMMSRAAQQFHFDMDRIKFIKFFVYLTNVTANNGPHCFIKTSHKKLPFLLKKDGRFDNNLIMDYYGVDNYVEIEGKAGTIIAVDTRGFHKGKPLVSGHRDILQVEFSNSLYGHNYEKSKIHHLDSFNIVQKELLNNF